MSRAGKEEMKGKREERGQKVLQQMGMMAKGYKPETWPQKSNYSSYREGVGTSP